MPRKLYEIAAEAIKDMGGTEMETKRKFPYAYPYLDAMGALNSINDNYGADSGKSIVLYFLANAQTWKGETARRIKKELKELVK